MAIIDIGTMRRKQDVDQSQYYHAWIPGVQAAGTGVPIDRSSNGNDGVRGAGLTDAALFANAGWLTSASIADNTGDFFVPKPAWNMANEDSIIIAFQTTGVSPSIFDGIFGTWSVAAQAGIRLVGNTNGKVRLGVSDGSNNKATGDSVNVIYDGSRESSIVIAIDGSTKLMWMYIDGVIDANISAVDISTVTGDTTPTNDVAFGNDGGSANITFPLQFRSINILPFPASGLPTNMQDIVNKLHSAPFYPLAETDITF